MIDYIKIKNDINGNPRIVIHWLSFKTKTYEEALKLAKKIGGKKYHNKSYGGGIVFQTYNIDNLLKRIQELQEVENG